MSRIEWCDGSGDKLIDIAYYGQSTRAEFFTGVWSDTRERVLLRVTTAAGTLGNLRATEARREAGLLSELRHPSIARCWGALECTLDDVPAVAIVLEWLPRSWDEILSRHVDGLDIPSLIGFIRAGLGALGHLHGQRIAVRFMAADSWGIDPRGTVKLAELSAARTLDRDPDVPELTRHLAPELLSGEVRRRLGAMPPPEAYFLCDLYSLGSLAFEAGAGARRLADMETLRSIQTPSAEIKAGRDDNSRWEQWHRTPQERFPSLRSLREDVPEWLSDMIASLLQKDCALRPHDARVLLDDVQLP